MLFSHSFTPSYLVNAHFASLVYTGFEIYLLLSESSLKLYLTPETVQGGVGQGFEQPSLVEVVSARGRRG